MTAILGIVILYLYGLVAYIYFRPEFNPEENGANCESLFYCFVTSMDLGMRSGGGLADVMSPVKYPTQAIPYQFNTSTFISELANGTGKNVYASFQNLTTELNFTNLLARLEAPDIDLTDILTQGVDFNLTQALASANVTLSELKSTLTNLFSTTSVPEVSGNLTGRFFFDLSFFIIITVILMNIVFGKTRSFIIYNTEP
jgi:hypothetical protein